MIAELQRQLEHIIFTDHQRRAALNTVKALNLPDWAIGAGFVRNAVWDHLHEFAVPTPLNDVDVLYFNPGDIDPKREQEAEEALAEIMPSLPWSVRNQARMHLRNGDAPYTSTRNAMSHWLEICTCVGVRIASEGQFEILAPHGLGDLFAMRISPTPSGKRRHHEYETRVGQKDWPATWPKAKLVHALNTEIDSID